MGPRCREPTGGVEKFVLGTLAIQPLEMLFSSAFLI